LGVDELGAHLSTVALIHPRYRVHFVDNARVISEDALSLRAFDRVGATGRPTCTVLLEGRARISAYGKHVKLTRGSAVLVAHKSAICMRQEGERYRSVAIEWDADTLAAQPEVPVSEHAIDDEALGEIDELVAASGTDDAPERVVQTLIERLRASGLPFTKPDHDKLVHDVVPRFAELSQALDEVLSQGGVRPTTVDLEDRMRLSTRQLNRLVESYHTTYGFNSEGWRDTVKRRRIMLGAALMTAAGATVIDVAQAIGFSSAEAFARALSEAGLPPPSEIRGEVLRLGALTETS
jgi:AraC-like DNA-binding protein